MIGKTIDELHTGDTARSLGIADEIVTLAFGLLLGSVAVAAAIGFGIGSKDIAGREVDACVKKLKGEK